jgi:hypothetical protein
MTRLSDVKKGKISRLEHYREVRTGADSSQSDQRNVADGSLADKPSRAKINLCPLLSESGQNVAAPRMSAKCHLRPSLQHGKAKRLFVVPDELTYGTSMQRAGAVMV